MCRTQSHTHTHRVDCEGGQSHRKSEVGGLRRSRDRADHVCPSNLNPLPLLLGRHQRMLNLISSGVPSHSRPVTDGCTQSRASDISEGGTSLRASRTCGAHGGCKPPPSPDARHATRPCSQTEARWQLVMSSARNQTCLTVFKNFYLSSAAECRGDFPVILLTRRSVLENTF